MRLSLTYVMSPSASPSSPTLSSQQCVQASIRTGPELIRATKPYAHDNPARSWWYIMSTGALMVTAFLGCIYNFHPALKLLCSVLAGLMTLRFFVIYHDQQHHAILPKSRLAEGVMRVFGILAISPSSVWRSSHNYHHNHNSNLRSAHIGSFPIMTRTQFARSSKARRSLYLVIRHPITITFGYVTMFLYGMCLNPFLNNPRKHLDCLVALVLHIAIGFSLCWFFGWQTMLVAQTIPCLITYGIGSYLFYAQHNFPGVSFSDSAGWAYEKAALESSSYMKTIPVMTWFTANIGFHHIHHLNHRIPFYRLPEVMKAIPELQNPRTTSLSPSEIIRCLRLKVWDVEKQSMVGHPGR